MFPKLDYWIFVTFLGVKWYNMKSLQVQHTQPVPIKLGYIPNIIFVNTVVDYGNLNIIQRLIQIPVTFSLSRQNLRCTKMFLCSTGIYA